MQTRSLAKLTGASLPTPGTFCTQCLLSGHTSRHCAIPNSYILSLKVPSSTLIAIARAKPALSTLPREIRDIIYENLVVSPFPIKVCYDYNTPTPYLRLMETGKRGIAAAFLCDALRGSALAAEVYEVFFKRNTFECGDCKIVEEFTRSRPTHFERRMSQSSNFVGQGRTFVKARAGEPYQPLQRQQLAFDKRPWLRVLKISLHCDNLEHKAAEQLGLVLNLPRLQRIDISIHGLCNKPHRPNIVDLKVAQIAAVCKKIREKIGSNLTVRVLKSWLGVCGSLNSHFLYENKEVKWEDVSWMWTPPTQEAIAMAGTCTAGSFREQMKVLMAAEDFSSNKELTTTFGELWYSDHMEQKILAKKKENAKNAVH